MGEDWNSTLRFRLENSLSSFKEGNNIMEANHVQEGKYVLFYFEFLLHLYCKRLSAAH